MKAIGIVKQMLAVSVVLAAPETLFAGGLPIYGSWCGPGHPIDLEARVSSGEDELPDPVDEIDSACKAHDLSYIDQKPWGNSKADAELAESMERILREKREELTGKQFLVATAILAYMQHQKFVTLYSDVINGRVSSILKIATSTGEASITVPVTLTSALMMRLADELGGPTVDVIEPIVAGGDLAVSFVIEMNDVTDHTVDEIGDIAKVIVNKVGDKTGLDKPVREAKEEIILLFTNPRKSVRNILTKTGNLGQEVIDIVLPWRW